MHVTHFDAALWTISVVGQLALILVMAHGKLYRTFPIFFAYLLYACVGDTLFFVWFRHFSGSHYFEAYFANNVPEFLFQLGILLEVARNVLYPVRRSLPISSLYVFAGMLLSGTVLAFILAAHARPPDLARWYQYFVQANLTIAILRVVIFSAIALFAQMLGIGWKNHVLQIASGFASYSILVLLIEFAHRYTGFTDESGYHMIDQFRIVGWCMALGYWSYSLAKEEAPRKEFSPKMENFLVSISEVARENRAAAARMVRK